jgi:hypothetical protein
VADGPLGWPLAGAVTQSDWVLGEALLGWPLVGMGLDPHLAHNALVLMGWFATAFALHLVARTLLGSGPHTWVAGIIGGLGPLQLAHGQHVNLVHHELAVLGPLLLGLGLHRGGAALAAIGGALTVLSVHFGVYVGLHALVVGLSVGAVALASRRGSRATYTAGVAGAGAMGLTVLPVAWVYGGVSRTYEVGLVAMDARLESWDLASTMRPIMGSPAHLPLSVVWPPPPRGGVLSLDTANPGYLALVLGVAGLVLLVRRRGVTWPWRAIGATGVVAAVLALGPEVVWAGRLTGIPTPYAGDRSGRVCSPSLR